MLVLNFLLYFLYIFRDTLYIHVPHDDAAGERRRCWGEDERRLEWITHVIQNVVNVLRAVAQTCQTRTPRIET